MNFPVNHWHLFAFPVCKREPFSRQNHPSGLTGTSLVSAEQTWTLRHRGRFPLTCNLIQRINTCRIGHCKMQTEVWESLWGLVEAGCCSGNNLWHKCPYSDKYRKNVPVFIRDMLEGMQFSMQVLTLYITSLGVRKTCTGLCCTHNLAKIRTIYFHHILY